MLLMIIVILYRQKSEVNFGLYSSSWTETNIRFKKSLLLTMQMNAAHKRTIKITPLCVVNMEMFAKVRIS